MAKASIRNAKREDLIPGALLRMCYSVDGEGKTPEPVAAGFSDCVIVEVRGDEVHLVRPRIAFIGGKPVTKAEKFWSLVERFVDKPNWQLVLNDRGNPENYA